MDILKSLVKQQKYFSELNKEKTMYFEKCKERIKSANDVKKFKSIGFFSESKKLTLVEKKIPLSKLTIKKAIYNGIDIPLKEEEFDELFGLMKKANERSTVEILGSL